jgi:hypothetical protein
MDRPPQREFTHFKTTITLAQLLNRLLFKEPLINVGEAVVARQKWPKKRIAPRMALIRALQEQLPSLQVVNEHFETIFNNATATQLINQRFLKLLQTFIALLILVSLSAQTHAQTSNCQTVWSGDGTIQLKGSWCAEWQNKKGLLKVPGLWLNVSAQEPTSINLSEYCGHFLHAHP